MQTIKLIEVSKSFKSKKALNKVNIEFHNNRINGLLGPNGSGKTTLFNIVAGFLSPDLGQILLDGNNLEGKSLNYRTKLGISYLPQEASIFRDLTVYENIFSIAELFQNKNESIKITDNLMILTIIRVEILKLKSDIIFWLELLVFKSIKLN